MSIFISWRGCNRTSKDKIVCEIRKILPNEAVWESDENCMTNFSKECMEAIHKCEVFVALLSEASMQMSYMLNEIIEARNLENSGKLNILVYKLEDFEYTPEFSMQLNHVPDSNYLGRLYGDDSGITTLITRIKFMLDRRRSGTPELPYDVNTPQIDGTILGKNRYFVDGSRTDELSKIDDAFNESNVIVLSYMDGYGKKSLIKKYLENNNFNVCTSLSSFNGSIKDFLVNELNFTNVNAKIFENISTSKLINKKIELLNKVQRDTLLVVPNVVFDKQDVDLIDLFDNINCKIIFVTQIVPNYIKDKWPNISVKSMETDKLKELFYHYIPNIDLTVKEKLDKSLSNYIDNVDGHTKTIELTSKNIADDMSISSNDIVNILDDLNTNKLETDLSKRIFESISNMFDVKNFSDEEKGIILSACYLCQMPLDENIFVNVLKDINLFNQDIINKLINLNWIDRDIVNKTISIEKLLANVCLKKINNEEVELNAFRFLVDTLSDSYVNGNYNNVKAYLKRLTIYFNSKDLTEITDIINLYLKEVDYRNEEVSKVSIKDVLDRLNIFSETTNYYFPNEEFEELFSILLYYLKKEFSLLLAITDYKDDNKLSNAVVSTILHDEGFSSLINECLETFENERLKNIINDLLFKLVSDENNIIYNVMLACNEISKLDKDEYEEELIGTYEVILLLLYNLVLTNKSNIYLCSKLCKKYIEIVDDLESDYDYEVNTTELYIITLTYFDTLIDLYDSSKELDNTFEDLMYLIKTNKDNIYTSETDYYEILASRLYYYTDNICYNNKLNNKIDELLSMFTDIPLLSDDIFSSKVNFIDKVFKYYIDNIMIDEAKDFINKYFNDDITSYNYDKDNRIVDTINNIISTRDTLLSPTLFDDFVDKAEVYEDYYKAFQLEYNDKKSYLLYTEIAKKAKDVDYSNLSSDDIKNEIKKLKMQAAMGMKWEMISPKAFALVSEVGYRILGYRHHLVQYIGASMMLDGKIAEIYNGEGKTYTIILVAFVKSLYNKKIRIIDSNEYLVKRNYTWMKGVLEELGLKVGMLTLSTLRNDLNDCDVVYEEILSGMYKRIATEFSFKANNSFDVAIVDEADLTIVEYASKPMYKTTNKVDEKYKELCEALHAVYKKVCDNKDKYWSFKNGRVSLKKEIFDYISREFNSSLTGLDQKEVNKIQEIFVACIETYEIFKINVSYYVVNNNIMVENKVTGKLLDVNPLYKFMIAKKEGLNHICETIKFSETSIDNFITVYEYIKDFEFVCGTTATASSMEHEFKKLYGLNVMRVPTNIPIKRIDNKPLVFYDFNAKMKHIISLIEEKHEKKQPVLLLSNSINESINVSKILKDKGIEHLLINGANIDKEAHLFNESGRLGMVTVSTSISNRGVDIVLGGNYTEMIKELLINKGYSKESVEKAIYEKSSDDYLIEEIREKYNALHSLYKQTATKEKEEILEVGGLCVIGTSCFEDLRIEQQLRGRAGRQGQAGESYVFYSFKDPNFQKLLGSSANFLDKMISTLGDDAIDSKLLNNTVERSRRILQNRIYESVVNKDEIIYFEKYRERLLEFKNDVLKKKITFDDIIDKYFINSKLVLRDITDHVKDGEPIKNYLSISLGKDITNYSKLKDKQIVKELERFIKTYLESNPDSIYHICNKYPEQLFMILEFIIGLIWKNYISKMNIEIDKYKNNQLVNINKKKKILNSISLEIFENEFHESITMFIFSKVRK